MTRCSSVAPPPAPPPHSRCWRGSAASSVKLPLPDTRPVFSHSDVRARTSSHVAKGGGQNVNKKKFGELRRSSLPPPPPPLPLPAATVFQANSYLRLKFIHIVSQS